MIYVDTDRTHIRARVLHTTAHYVFILYSENIHENIENRGVKVVEPRECQTPDTPGRPVAQGRFGGGMYTANPRRSELVGKTVRITRGVNKGQLGDVKEADQNILRVVLHSSGRQITLNRSEGDGANETATWEFTDNTKTRDPFVALFKSGRKPDQQPSRGIPEVYDRQRVMPPPLEQPNYGLPHADAPPAYGGHPAYGMGYQYAPPEATRQYGGQNYGPPVYDGYGTSKPPGDPSGMTPYQRS
jgi:hypothetical protein